MNASMLLKLLDKREVDPYSSEDAALLLSDDTDCELFLDEIKKRNGVFDVIPYFAKEVWHYWCYKDPEASYNWLIKQDKKLILELSNFISPDSVKPNTVFTSPPYMHLNIWTRFMREKVDPILKRTKYKIGFCFYSLYDSFYDSFFKLYLKENFNIPFIQEEEVYFQKDIPKIINILKEIQSFDIFVIEETPEKNRKSIRMHLNFLCRVDYSSRKRINFTIEINPNGIQVSSGYSGKLYQDTEKQIMNLLEKGLKKYNLYPFKLRPKVLDWKTFKTKLIEGEEI